MKVLINDGMHKAGIDLFHKNEIVTDINKRNPSELVQIIHDFDALVVRSRTQVSENIIEAGANGKLKIIGRAGVGYDNVDIKNASKYGIVVKFAPYGNTNSTAELSLGLMFNVARNIVQSHYSLKQGIWRKKDFEGTELAGKTLGIIGCGRIGQKLGEKANALGMTVIGNDPFLEAVCKNFPESKIKYVTKEELLETADYVSLHISGKDEVIGENEIELMKPSAILINASRGSNINEDALYKALFNKKIRGAGIDVYRNEPDKEGGVFTSKIINLENVVLTSHLGASTKEAQKETSKEMAQVTIDYLLKGDFSNAVNVGETIYSEEEELYNVWVFHEDKPGVFAKIDSIFAEYNINIRRPDSRKMDGVAITVYSVQQNVSEEILDKIREIKDIRRVIN
ncbi:MAG: NAD(P)-dependent oxidoreductase [archaeon]